MAITQISRIQNRRGLKIDLPSALNTAEFGWASDTRELYIGNGPPFGGNTQILTELTPPNIPSYSYLSNTGIDAVTGADSIDPSLPDATLSTIRSYQEKFDDFVNIRDYGAVGDGVNDDVGAILRAMRDIYDEVSAPIDQRRKRAIYFPAGTYRISQAIPLYPFCNLIGDGKGRTIIFLDYVGFGGIPNPNITAFVTGNDCVARTVDSKGDSALNIGLNTPTYLPQNIKVSGITFESNTPQNIPTGPRPTNGSTKDIIKLDQASNVRFDNCEFKGSWVIGNTDTFEGSVGILISRVGNTTIKMKGYTFNGCSFSNLVHAFNILDTISDVNIIDCDFDILHNPIKIGFLSTVFDTLNGTGLGSALAAPELIRVSHSRFTNYEGIAFDVRSSGRGNISSFNHYGKNSVNPAVNFDSNTEGCVSIGDTFDEDTIFTCAGKLISLRARNFSSKNIIMNAQDLIQIPDGFCGNISIDGNLTVTGNLLVNGNIINTQSSFTPSAGAPITSIPYTSGNIIFFEYGMNLNGPGPGNVYRAGIMKIAHNGDGSLGVIDPTLITFADSYTELGGPPSNPITLSADLNSINGTVDINVNAGSLFPTFNFSIRIMTV